MTGFLRQLPLDEWYGWTVEAKYRRGLAQLAQQSAQSAGIRITTRWTVADPGPNGEDRMRLAIKRMEPKKPRVPRTNHEVPFVEPQPVTMPNTSNGHAVSRGTVRRTPVRTRTTLADMVQAFIQSRTAAVERRTVPQTGIRAAVVRPGQCEASGCVLSHTRILSDGRKVCTTHARQAGE